MNADRRRRLGLLGLLLSVLIGLTVWPTATSQADTELVSIELTTITPTVLTDSGELVISGRLTNQSNNPVQRVEVRLWRDATPLTSLDDLERAETSNQPSGATMDAPDARQSINQAGWLQPGETAQFSVRARLDPGASDQLWLSQPNAAYQVGVEVYGSTEAGSYQRLGRASSLMAYPGTATVSVGTIVLLNYRPTLLPLAASANQPPVFADDSLLEELHGRLEVLLRAGERPGTQVLIDPALYDEVSYLANAHRVIGPDGVAGPVIAAGNVVAQRWLDRIHQLAADNRLARTMSGSIDLAQAADAQRSDLITTAATLPAGHQLAELPLVVVPYQCELDQAAAVALPAADVSWVLADNLGPGRLVRTAEDRTIVTTDCAAAASSQTAVQRRGRLLAHQLIGARDQVPDIQLVTTAEQAEFASANESWRVLRPVPELIAAAAPAGSVAWPLAETPAVDQDLRTASDHAGQLLTAWGELVGETNTDELERKLFSGVWSSTFGRDNAQQIDWLARTIAPAEALTGPDGLQLRISDWVTTSADDNLLPVTVINTTDREVQVRVHFDSDNPLRISVEDSPLFSVQPGESTTVRVRPRTQGNGIVAVRAELTTSSGYLVGTPAGFSITGTEAGRVAWLIIVASGVVLLVATSLRVYQVRREHRHN